MRPVLLAGLITASLAASEAPVKVDPATAGRAPSTTVREAKNETRPTSGFVNAKVSNRDIAFNQPVRVEFTTMPRQVDGVDIGAAVGNALTLGTAGEQWRPLAPPKVSEHDKTHTVTVSFAIAPRRTGTFALPTITTPWLANDQPVDLGLVNVAPKLLVGTEQKELPKEVDGVAGFAWGVKAEDVKARLGVSKREGAALVAHPAPGLALSFRGEVLVEATLDVAGLDLAGARDSFLERWGVPQIEERADDAAPITRLTWILGWTRIVAEPAEGGIRLHLAREDIQARLARAAVGQRIFGVLEGPGVAPEADPAAEPAKRASDAEKDFGKPAIPPPSE